MKMLMEAANKIPKMQALNLERNQIRLAMLKRVINCNLN